MLSSGFLINDIVTEPESIPVYDSGFTFYDVEKIKSTLSESDISLSTPIAITDYTSREYCTFFDEQDNRVLVEYCTTTAILDSDGKTIGNINIGGTSDSPIMALAIIDSPKLDSKSAKVKIVFESLIESLVCDCWDELQPGGFESVGVWVDVATAKYYESTLGTLTSKIDGIGDTKLILEITTEEDSYLWTLIILK